MSKPRPIACEDAGADVRAIHDDIMRTRGAADVTNFWTYLANDPVSLGSICVPVDPEFE